MSEVKQTQKVAERIVVIGRLVLQSPAHLGNGDVSFFTDSPIFRDMDGQPVLSGATLAGALRAYLSRIDSQLASELFGYVTGANSANGPSALETALLVNDARAKAAPVEFRDGVAISPKTRTAEQKKKFDLELLAADVAFDVHLELAPGPQDRSDLDQLKRGFVTVLKALEDGHIPLGKRKTRGFGECKVVEWRAQIFNLAQPKQLLDWLKWDGRPETLALNGPS
ncbi:MAG: RAMP superfamily CRISPR-associated protein, partial [Aggregatilineales bacterium]